MNSLVIDDLDISRGLDRAAAAELKGSGTWHLRGRSVSTGNWSGYQFRYSVYRGIRFHDGYLHRHYVQGWKRSRVQTEYTSWDRFVKV